MIIGDTVYLGEIKVRILKVKRKCALVGVLGPILNMRIVKIKELKPIM